MFKRLISCWNNILEDAHTDLVLASQQTHRLALAYSFKGISANIELEDSAWELEGPAWVEVGRPLQRA